MLSGNEIRSKFIEFFKDKGHRHFESASLIPDDPTLLLTVAGMVPFKPYFLGQKEPPCPRVTTYQKCIRTNDLENVGRTARHHTFFEMLGNFSFGDYFKKEAIHWSLEFVTQILHIDQERLWVSVFTTDDEAEELWKQEGIRPERIVRFGEEDNWWAAGPTGSCGPCSEIYVDLGVEFGGDANSRLGDADTDNRFIEIWNLVFTEWNRKEDGTLEPLPKKNIDTGAGLERITAVIQGKHNNFETDLLFPLVEEAGRLSGKTYGTSEKVDFSLKVITDHARAVTFLINDGVIPSNEGRGYVLRRILRRAIRHGRLLGQRNLFLYQMIDKVVEIMSGAYPDLVKNADHIKKIVTIEEEKFSRTLDAGMKLVDDMLGFIKKSGGNKLPGDVAFKLYDTYGFPFELTEEICGEYGIEISKAEFEAKMEEQKELARNSREVVMERGQDTLIEDLYDKFGATTFTGYDKLEDTGKLLSFIQMPNNRIGLIFDKTPFYGESGGQCGDKGVITGPNFSGNVVDVQKQKGVFTHILENANGDLTLGADYKLSVDKDNRFATMKNHTAVHLLHRALQVILGDHVQQAGSYVDGDRLRFDFNHYTAITEEQLEQIEMLVNIKIAESIPVTVENMPIDEAIKKGAKALFTDKYGDIVRVITVGDYSCELCGGTHIDNTGKIGIFKIQTEEGIAAGIRRIMAKTSMSAYNDLLIRERFVKGIGKTLKSDFTSMKDKIDKLLETQKENEKEIASLKGKLMKYEAGNFSQNAENINGTNVIIRNFADKSAEELRNMADYARQQNPNSIVVLSSGGDKVVFTIGVPKALTTKVKAGDLAREAAKIAGGNGGGRPDFAQSGGKDPTKINDAISQLRLMLKNIL